MKKFVKKEWKEREIEKELKNLNKLYKNKREEIIEKISKKLNKQKNNRVIDLELEIEKLKKEIENLELTNSNLLSMNASSIKDLEEAVNENEVYQKEHENKEKLENDLFVEKNKYKKKHEILLKNYNKLFNENKKLKSDKNFDRIMKNYLLFLSMFLVASGFSLLCFIEKL